MFFLDNFSLPIKRIINHRIAYYFSRKELSPLCLQHKESQTRYNRML